MTGQSILEERRELLATIVSESLGNMPHSDAFAIRVLGLQRLRQVSNNPNLGIPIPDAALHYQGYPGLATLGYGLGSGVLAQSDVADSFVNALQRLRSRPETNLTSFITDDVAILGVAEGLSYLRDHVPHLLTGAVDWLLHLLDHNVRHGEWSTRMRDVAADLLDYRGRVRTLLRTTDPNAMSLELVLQSTWPSVFRHTSVFSEEAKGKLLSELVIQAPPSSGDLERAVTWFRATEVIIDHSVRTLIPSVSDTVYLLNSIQHAMKRWRWEDKSTRNGVMPTRWLVDNEYDVQSMLWAMLYPIYQNNLVDERYLPNWGQVQPRVDMGILSLKLIIEVKIARRPSDFAEIEEQVGGDLGLYFKETYEFDKMIVFVYDDCDKHQPEKYDGLKNALKKRDRIEDVVIIRRPSMIPDRGKRTAI